VRPEVGHHIELDDDFGFLGLCHLFALQQLITYLYGNL
jgi:hypothetical protein